MVKTRGFAFLSFAKGFASIFFLIFSHSNSAFGIGPIMPKWLRVGIKNTGIAPVIIIECNTDL